MNCPACDYEFDPSRGLQCPRCGQAIDCGEVGCSNCDACDSLFEQLGQRVRSK